MANRRNFLKKSGALISAAYLTYMDAYASLLKNNKLGIQLFSLPKMLSEDFLGAIKMLKNMGYSELELYGPYMFSAESNQKSWEAAAAMLGFSGSGYFGHSIREMKKILDDHGMKAPSAHTDLDTLENHMYKLGEAAAILGHQYVTLPAIPDERRKTTDDYKKLADAFNIIGANAQKNGVKFGYHNHGYGIKPTKEGIVPLEILIENTDPDLVFLEMDIFWTACGGADPIAYLKKYANRYKMLHLKDMKVKKQFEGDGGGMGDWMAMFPNMTTAGDGVMDLKGIITTAEQIGVEHYFVEQDMVASPNEALAKSYDYLSSII